MVTCNKIMVVEDEDMLLQAIVTKMNKMGIETVSCATGEQALDYLGSLEELPSAIWLDYYLKGGMDGLELLQNVKANEAWKNIPIVVVSNAASEDKVQNMLALGAERYLVKAEHRLDDMISTICDFIENEG